MREKFIAVLTECVREAEEYGKGEFIGPRHHGFYGIEDIVAEYAPKLLEIAEEK